MDRFEGKIAVVTGGGTGMGRELARQLAADGCHVAMCDVSEETLAHTRALCEQAAPPGTRITTCLADVSDEGQVNAFRAAVARDHQTHHVNLVFNNAGIGGGGSFVDGDREEWEATFAVCWNGVYYCSRAFVPMLVASDEGHLVNTSSVNGFWASLGPMSAHSAYSAAKFAVKGFSEALITDFRNNAPHVKVSVVMPGHIGTSIAINSGRYLGRDPKEMSDEALEEVRERYSGLGLPVGDVSNEELRVLIQQQGERFRDEAPMTAAEAATVILNGVKKGQWRILVGNDAQAMDRLVREDPESAYEPSFFQKLAKETSWRLGGDDA